jgi:hypothetical protein
MDIRPCLIGVGKRKNEGSLAAAEVVPRMHGGGWSSCLMMTNLGQKKCTGVGISYAKGIGKWLGSAVASRRQVGGDGRLDEGEENGEGEDISNHCPLL